MADQTIGSTCTFVIGLYFGFDHPTFGLGVAITMIVTYDAAGVRQQVGSYRDSSSRRPNGGFGNNYTVSLRGAIPLVPPRNLLTAKSITV
jgi:uncharacterized protein YcsI (UPF0317 family)